MLEKITNVPRDYAWGSRTLLATLEGRPASAEPEAEVWFGDHPGCPAQVAGSDTLDVVLREAGQERLPYLLKLLAAASPLSIQVHPSQAQAQAGWAAQADLPEGAPRNYQDDNHKPEMIVALGERFEALAGLRELEASRRYFAALGDAEGVTQLRTMLDGVGAADDADILRDVLTWLLSGDSASAVADVIMAVADARSDEFAAELDAARRIAGFYPGDPGVVVAMLMNFVVLAPGEAIFLRSGLLHAYLDGIGVEIMAASDNVLRGGLTPKHIDVPELMSLLDTRPGEVPVQRVEATIGEISPYGPGIPDFALAVTRVAEDDVVIPISGPTTLLVTAGVVELRAGERVVTVRAGEAGIAVGDVDAVTVHRAEGEAPAEVFIATPGDDSSNA